MDRRGVLKVAGAVTAAATALVALPRVAFAAYSDKAFKQKAGADALQNAYGANATTPSDQVKLKAPDIAENGAVVPVTVSSTIENVEAIYIYASNNPTPLTSAYEIAEGAEAFVSTRIKMGTTADVVAVVKANGKLMSAKKEVKVTIGGCGG